MNNTAPYRTEGMSESIAIIGMAGRFPGANSLEQFWQNLRNGVESISRFTDEQLLAAGVDPNLLQHPHYVKAGAVLEAIDQFNAAFFGFNPKEAEMMDPQQRLFLELAWHALENAGYTTESNTGDTARIGAFAGVGWSSYLFNNLSTNPDIIESVGGYQTLLGNDKDFLATRLAYKLNLRGPCYTVQTACSTSLVAISLACRSLLNYQCDLVLAGGVSVFVPHQTGYLYQEGSIFSPDGHCRAFDARAQGTIVGSGAGIIVLKRLEEAIADGDSIHAVIRGTAVNNDGASKVGYTAPSVDGQAEVITEALALADVEPDSITYVEAHGTGTALGDPIEVTALTQAFRTQTQRQGFCAIGSVKTNVGHLDAAAGVAGLIKTVLALKHKQIPPSLHFEHPNPQIDFAASPFYVNTQLAAWNPDHAPRRAGVSAFGIGGTNAHVILEEAPPVAPSGASRPCQLLLLSTKTKSALECATANLASHLQHYPDLNLADVAYTLHVGRTAFEHRRMLVCQSVDEAVTALEIVDPQQILTYVPDSSPGIAFLFPGQGSQYVNMALELYQTEPLFRQQVDECAAMLKPHLGLDLRSVLYPEEFPSGLEPLPSLDQTALAQPALFVIEYALAKLWMAWGVQPQALIGHSIGEYVAATLAGVFSLEDALVLVARRGQLMQSMPTGAMLSVSLPVAEVEPLLSEGLTIAAENAPSLCVVSGELEAIAPLQQHLTEQGIECRRLQTSHAFHSAMMEPMLEAFTQQVQRMRLSPPQIPFISNVTGTWITSDRATDPTYWSQHLRQTVQFAAGVRELMQEGNRVFLEVGPGRTLSTLVRQQAPQSIVLTSIRHPKDTDSDVAFLLGTLGRLWLVGMAIDWSGFYANERRHRLPLPGYPFERQRYWVEGKKAEGGRQKTEGLSASFQESSERSSDSSVLRKQSDVKKWFYRPSWKRSLSFTELQAVASLPVQRWLIFQDACGVAAQLIDRLRSQGHEVITVAVGEQFNSSESNGELNRYTINPACREDYDTLFSHLRRANQIPDRIIHAWGISADDIATDRLDLMQQSIDRFEAIQETGFYSLLFLTQAIAKQNIADPFAHALGQRQTAQSLSIAVLTNQVQTVMGDEVLRPAKATVLALCRSIPQEYPTIACRTIDIVLPAEPPSPDSELTDGLLADLMLDPVDASESVAAHRGQYRWVQTFEPIEEQEFNHAMPLRQAGVYVITGALTGDVGLGLAEHLARTVQARLVLIAPPTFPPQTDWAQWLLTHDSQDRISLLIKQLQTLEALGSEVLVCPAEGTNLAQMQRSIEQACDRFGTIHGVIHAVETIEDGIFRPIQQTSRTECQWHFQPKVHGLLVLQQALQQVLQDRKLDLCWLQSSITALLGGTVAHAAANLFMDAFAHAYYQPHTLPWLSINWDHWQFWNDQPPAALHATIATLAMTPDEGSTALQQMLSLRPTPQIVISTAHLMPRLAQSLRQTTLSAPVTPAPASHARPNLQTTYAAPRTAIEQAVCDIWQDLLGIEPIGIYDNFFELGGHSLLAVQTISRLRDRFQVELPLKTLLFEAPTIADLAAILAEQQPDPNELDAVAQLLATIETLSPEEAQRQFAEEI